MVQEDVRDVPVRTVFPCLCSRRLTPALGSAGCSESTNSGDEDIGELLRACDEIGDLLDLKQADGERWPVEEIISRAVELVRMPECP